MLQTANNYHCGRGIGAASSRFFLWLALASCFGLAASPLPAAAPSRKPNIIVILTDDQGYADVGKFGAKGFVTPHLDRLADQGAVFRNFHVSQPVCSASRASLLTGCYANRLGIHLALGPGSPIGLGENETTLAQLLRRAGYATAMYGKWHLGDAPQFRPLRRGFDEYFGLMVSNDYWPGHPDLITAIPAPIAAKKRGYPDLSIWEGDRKFREEMSTDDLNLLTTWYTERRGQLYQNGTVRSHFSLSGARRAARPTRSQFQIPRQICARPLRRCDRGN
jgi:arylsulfatase